MPTLFLLFLTFLPLQDKDSTVEKELRSGVQLKIPKKWTETKPKSKLRLAQFSVPHPKKEAGSAELVIFYFGRSGGGSAEANIDRWISQFEGATRETTKITKIETKGKLKATLAETRPGSGQRRNEADTRMMAAILETPMGNHYLKLVGPAATVNAWEKEFTTLIREAGFREKE